MDKWTQFTIWVDKWIRSAHWMKIFPLCLSFRISSLRSVSGWSDLTTCTWSLTGSNSPWSPESLQYSGGQGLEIPLTSHDFWVVHSGIGWYRMLWGYTTSHFSFSSHAQMGYTIVDEACLQPLASGWMKWNAESSMIWETRRFQKNSKSIHRS